MVHTFFFFFYCTIDYNSVISPQAESAVNGHLLSTYFNSKVIFFLKYKKQLTRNSFIGPATIIFSFIYFCNNEWVFEKCNCNISVNSNSRVEFL